MGPGVGAFTNSASKLTSRRPLEGVFPCGIVKRRAPIALGASIAAFGLAIVVLGCSPAKTTQPPVVDVASDPDLQGPDFFKDVTKAAHVDFAYRNGEEVQPPHLAILESLGGGIGLIDFDGDGLIDIYIPGGGYYAGKDHKRFAAIPAGCIATSATSSSRT